jgi:hypothetical protein
MNLQPIASIFLGYGWSVGYSGNILADWKAPSGDIWTAPAPELRGLTGIRPLPGGPTWPQRSILHRKVVGA